MATKRKKKKQETLAGAVIEITSQWLADRLTPVDPAAGLPYIRSAVSLVLG